MKKYKSLKLIQILLYLSKISLRLNIYSETPPNDHPYIKTTPIIRAAFVGPKLPFPY